VPILSHMIISEQQVQLVLEYLHTKHQPIAPHDHSEADGATEDLVDRVRRQLADVPDTRVERVAHGREFIASHSVTSDEVAAKMIGRIISDSMR
jgi:hypothetical protein